MFIIRINPVVMKRSSRKQVRPILCSLTKRNVPSTILLGRALRPVREAHGKQAQGKRASILLVLASISLASVTLDLIQAIWGISSQTFLAVVESDVDAILRWI